MNANTSERRRLLLIVEDTFAIEGRGLTVAPDVDLGPEWQRSIVVELRPPDGTIARVDALAQVPFIDPPRPGPRPRHMLLFASVSKQDIPIGTEVWMTEET